MARQQIESLQQRMREHKEAAARALGRAEHAEGEVERLRRKRAADREKAKQWIERATMLEAQVVDARRRAAEVTERGLWESQAREAESKCVWDAVQSALVPRE